MTNRLFLNEQEVDLDVKSIITLRSQINDIADLTTRNSSFSYEINLPFTKKNRRIMESAEVVTSASGLPYKKLQAKITKNGVEVVPFGTAELLSVEDGYKIQVMFGGYDFWEAIDGKLLSDLGQVNTAREIYADPNLPDSLPYSFIDPFGASSFSSALLQQVSSAAGQEAVFLNYGVFNFAHRFATFRIEIRTGAWGASKNDGPQSLSVIVGAVSVEIDSNVQPNFTYVKHIFLEADTVASSTNYGISMSSTFTGSGVINEVTYLRITECPSLSSYDHVFGISAVTSSRANTAGFKYPIIDYGDLDNVTPTVNPKNQRPAVFASAIVEAIVKEAGFIPQGKLFADPRFKKQLHPFTNDKAKHSEKWIEDHSFRVHVEDYSLAGGTLFTNYRYMGFDDETSPGYFDNGSLITLGTWADPASSPALAFLTYPEPGIYKLTLTITFTVTGFGSTGSNFTLEYFGVLIYSHNETGLGNGTFTKTFENILEIPDTSVAVSETPILSATNCVVALTDTTWEGAPVLDGVYYGSTWEIAANLDEMSQKDFLKSIMQMYCIVPDVDKYSKEVKFRFFNEIIENKVIAVDWSDKVNEKGKSGIEFKLDGYARKNTLNYATDSDDVQTTKGFGYGFFLCDNENLKGEKSVCELRFAPTTTQLRLNNLRIPIITKIEDGKFGRKTLPRVLIDDTQDVTTGAITWNDGTTSMTTIYSIPISFFAKGTPFDLWFDSVVNTRVLASPTGLIYDYFTGIIQALTSARVLSESLNITPADFADLDHFIPRYIAKFGAHFYVNVLDKFTGAKDSGAEVQLIRI